MSSKDKVLLTEQSLADAVNNLAEHCKENNLKIGIDQPFELHIDLKKVIQFVKERDRLKWIAYWQQKYDWR